MSNETETTEIWIYATIILILVVALGINVIKIDTRLDRLESNCTCAQTVEGIEQ